MNDVDFPVANVLAGLEAAQAVGLSNIKVNMVVKRGTNDHQILPMARHFQNTGITLRFIEYMGVGATNGWCMDEVLSSAEVVQRLSAALPLVQPRPPVHRWPALPVPLPPDATPQLGRRMEMSYIGG